MERERGKTCFFVVSPFAFSQVNNFVIPVFFFLFSFLSFFPSYFISDDAYVLLSSASGYIHTEKVRNRERKQKERLLKKNFLFFFALSKIIYFIFFPFQILSSSSSPSS